MEIEFKPFTDYRILYDKVPFLRDIIITYDNDEEYFEYHTEPYYTEYTPIEIIKPYKYIKIINGEIHEIIYILNGYLVLHKLRISKRKEYRRYLVRTKKIRYNYRYKSLLLWNNRQVDIYKIYWFVSMFDPKSNTFLDYQASTNKVYPNDIMHKMDKFHLILRQQWFRKILESKLGEKVMLELSEFLQKNNVDYGYILQRYKQMAEIEDGKYQFQATQALENLIKEAEYRTKKAILLGEIPNKDAETKTLPEQKLELPEFGSAPEEESPEIKYDFINNLIDK